MKRMNKKIQFANCESDIPLSGKMSVSIILKNEESYKKKFMFNFIQKRMLLEKDQK